MYPSSNDPCVLLTQIRDILSDIREATRVSEFAFSTPTRSTTGTGALYAAADTYSPSSTQGLPLEGRYATLMLWDNNAIMQIANRRFSEWQALELTLRAPGTYAMPLQMKSFRIRAANATYQAKYSLLLLD